jgi:hypothetical protein
VMYIYIYNFVEYKRVPKQYKYASEFVLNLCEVYSLFLSSESSPFCSFVNCKLYLSAIFC